MNIEPIKHAVAFFEWVKAYPLFMHALGAGATMNHMVKWLRDTLRETIDLDEPPNRAELEKAHTECQTQEFATWLALKLGVV